MAVNSTANRFMNYYTSLLLKGTATVIAVAVCFMSCHEQSDTEKAIQWQQHRLKQYQEIIYPAALRHVHHGCIITRLGTDVTSEMFRKMNQHDQSFSHCGIAMIENDTVFVYHALGGEFNPNQKLRRETLYSFCHPSDNKALAIFEYHIDPGVLQKLKKIVHKNYSEGMPFDLDFNYNTENRLYCAEFVS